MVDLRFCSFFLLFGAILTKASFPGFHSAPRVSIDEEKDEEPSKKLYEALRYIFIYFIVFIFVFWTISKRRWAMPDFSFCFRVFLWFMRTKRLVTGTLDETELEISKRSRIGSICG